MTDFLGTCFRLDRWVITDLPISATIGGTSRKIPRKNGTAHVLGTWHVEVKATTEDDPQFELGISEVEAANRLARTQGGLWRILRIRKALSDRPEFDWLPNPFEGDFRKHFRFYRGGMMMSYARKKP